MSSNSTWAPNEDHQTLVSERCWLQGAIISVIAYGITVPLYFQSFHLLIQGRNLVDLKKRLPLLIYLVISFLLGTLYTIFLAGVTQMAFIDNRNYPGGPSAYETNISAIPINEASSVVFTLSNWLCDALLVWRFKVIYQSCGFPMWIVMFCPCLVFASSVALGTLCLIQDMSTNPSEIFVLPYAITTLSLNIMLTFAIAFRLMRFRYNIVSVMGPNYGAQYTTISAMIIESAALFSSAAIAFLISFGTGNPVSQVFEQSLSPIQTIATLLIVFRIARGNAWNNGTTIGTSVTTRGSEPIELSRVQFTTPGGSFGLASSQAGEGMKIRTRVEHRESLDVSTCEASRDVV